jgi:ABC-type lipoprotein release transport system permease subunit
MDSLRDTMVEGEPISAADARGLMIGTRLAAKIGASVGSKVVIMAGKSGGDIEAQMGRVRGIYHTGVDELDGFAMFTGLELSRRFLLAEGADPAAGPLTQVSVFLDRHDAWPVAKARLQALGLPTGAVVLDWQEIMPQMVTFLVLDDVGHFIQVGLLLLLVAFGILNTILMSVLERTREFGLPRPIGLGRARLLALVVVETALLAILALLAGWAIGGSLVGYGSVHGIDLSMASGSAVQGRGYYLDAIIYPVLSPLRVLELTALVFGVTFISGIYPAVRASRVSPIRAIQA